MKNFSCARIILQYPSKPVKNRILNRIFSPIAMFIWRYGYLKHDDGGFFKYSQNQENNYVRKKFSAHWTRTFLENTLQSALPHTPTPKTAKTTSLMVMLPSLSLSLPCTYYSGTKCGQALALCYSQVFLVFGRSNKNRKLFELVERFHLEEIEMESDE